MKKNSIFRPLTIMMSAMISVLFFVCTILSACGGDDNESSSGDDSYITNNSFEMKNVDGVTIYYRMVSDGELEVRSKGDGVTYYQGSVVIPEEVTYNNKTRKVTRIGMNAFAYCKDLTSVTIPSSIVLFDIDAFRNCENLKKIIVKDVATFCGIQIKSADSNPFSYARLYSDENTEIKNLVIPNSVTTIADAIFANCQSITSLTISNSVKNIGEFAFSGCANLAKVTIGNNVESIGQGAFSGCTSLPYIVIPDNVTSMGSGVFSCCYGLTNVTIGNGLKEISDLTFSYCKALSYSPIPNSVTTIGYHAFYNCTSLAYVIIPNSTSTIKVLAFEGCDNLTSVTIGKNVKTIEAGAFSCSKLVIVKSLIEEPFKIVNVFSHNALYKGILWVPKGTQEKYKKIEGWKEFAAIKEGDGS